MTAPKLTDKLGVKIEVGDYIAYPHLFGRSAELQLGVIKEIKTAGSDRGFGRAPHHTLRVRGLNMMHVGRWDEPRQWKLLERDGTLQYVERVIVLRDDMLPIEAWQLLRVHYIAWYLENSP